MVLVLAPCAFAGRLGLTAWRRKSSLLLLALLLILIIFGVHYNVGGFGVNTPIDLPQKDSLISIRAEVQLGDDANRRKTFDGDSNSVHFVQNENARGVEYKFNHKTEEEKPVDEKEIRELEQPSRDDIARRRSENDVNAIDNNEQSAYDTYASQGLGQMGIPFINVNLKNPYIPQQRLVHLDLKGAPPKIAYLKRLFPLLKTLGATGILLEYEDMFPFVGALADIAAENAYTRAEVQEILQAALDNSLEVIPLIQTFGHLEFALKRESFVHLREVPDSPQALCPSLNQSMDFIENMINQVMEAHGPSTRHLHVGCDEVYQMGECARCRRGGARDQLFLRHVRAVADLLARRWPRARALVWDDMLRHVPRAELLASGLGSSVDPVVWAYPEDVYRFVPTHVWDKYASVFSTVWSASAFKGAFGETQYVPNAKRHLENNLRWLEVMAQEGPKFKNGFAGIVLTGWQRYDHFAVLCELLPAAIPSLALTLTAVSRGHLDAALAEGASGALGCPAPAPRPPAAPALSLHTDPHMWDKFARCLFPGNTFFKLTYRLHVAETEVNDYLDQTTRQKGWMTAYNVRHNFSAPLRVTELTGDLSRLQRSLSSLARAASDALNEAYDAHTIAEWVEQRIYPDIVALEKVQADAQALMSRRTWPRRPLPPLADLRRLGVPVPQPGQ